MKILRSILENIDPIFVEGNLDISITGIAYDSRNVLPGNLFVCIEGFNTDGHKYIAQALENGATALIVQKEVLYPVQVTLVRVSDSRLALAQVSAAFYDFPAEKLNILGVTGTNGKTTITYLLSAVLRHIGKKTGLIGTIHNLIGDEVVATARTTPESNDLQALFAQMGDAGVSDVIMEVSSHALTLERVALVRFKGAIFTNLTQDHLDFHKTMDNYFDAKIKMFTLYHHMKRINVINADDTYGQRLLKLAVGKTVSYGIKNSTADFKAADIKLMPNGISYTLVFGQKRIDLVLKLLGEFNVYNSLAVAAYAISAGIDHEIVKKALETAGVVPGRFEIVDAGQPFAVAVDYAHTPDGLENILTSARKFVAGRIITVFGCGGDRDRTKRPKMGAIAARLSDRVYVTSDNPRTEEPQEIIDNILEGISEDRTSISVMVDRRMAIASALIEAKPNDIVIIAGKGHEDYQVLKNKTIHFDDREEARRVLQEMGYENTTV